MTRWRWQEWNRKAFRRARKKGRPVLLFLTTSWCQACRAMESRVFSDEDVAQLISRSFVPVKVDSDRRPDIWRRFTMGAWPSVVFLTAGGDFITGTTYAAPDEFLSLLSAVSRHTRAGAEAFRAFPEAGTTPNPGPRVIRTDSVPLAPVPYFSALAAANLDSEHGGFGVAPKFPFPPAGRYLLARAFMGEAAALDALELTLNGMADGGLRGPYGGFHRLSAGADWSRPRPERLLVDQAELAALYLDAYSMTKNPLYREAAAGALDFMESRMGRTDGGFNTAVLDEPRAKRDGPAFSGPNARAASAFIKADAVLGRPTAADLGRRIIDFLFDNFQGKRGLFRHSLEKTGATDPEFLSDQVDTLLLLADAYEASGNNVFINEAQKLAWATVKFLFDLNSGAFLDSRPMNDAHFPNLVPYRPIDENARAAIALMRLGGLTGRRCFLETAESALAAFVHAFRAYGLSAADYGLAVMWLHEPKLEIFLSARNRRELRAGPLWRAARTRYHPRKLIVIDGRRPLKSPPLKSPAPSSPAAVILFGDRETTVATDSDELIARISDAA